MPGSGNVNADVAMRVSRLQVASQMTVRVNGALQRNVEIPGPPATAQEYDTFDRLGGPVPVPLRFALALQARLERRFVHLPYCSVANRPT